MFCLCFLKMKTMKSIVKSAFLFFAFAIMLSACIVAGPAYYRPRYRAAIVRPYYPAPHFYGGHHYHYYRGARHYRR